MGDAWRWGLWGPWEAGACSAPLFALLEACRVLYLEARGFSSLGSGLELGPAQGRGFSLSL